MTARSKDILTLAAITVVAVALVVKVTSDMKAKRATTQNRYQ